MCGGNSAAIVGGSRAGSRGSWRAKGKRRFRGECGEGDRIAAGISLRLGFLVLGCAVLRASSSLPLSTQTRFSKPACPSSLYALRRPRRRLLRCARSLIVFFDPFPARYSLRPAVASSTALSAHPQHFYALHHHRGVALGL